MGDKLVEFAGSIPAKAKHVLLICNEMGLKKFLILI